MLRVRMAGLLCLSIIWLPLIVSANRQEAEGWDFVPGEKILLFDDFTDMPRGAAPPHWKVRGGAVRLVDGRLTPSDNGETRLFPNITKWPDNFTIEMDFQSKMVDDPDIPTRRLDWQFEKDENWVWHVTLTINSAGEGDLLLEIADPGGESQRASCKWLKDQPNKYAIWVQDGRLRIYMNGNRLIDINQVKLSFQTSYLWVEGSSLPVSFGSFRIAESAPDISKTILSSGRYVTHGIQFDVNSATLKPESKPVLQQVADALVSAPSLKFQIEGHTDSSGDPAKNLDLSKRRAESVKQALVEQFNIAPDRLSTEGFGDTKPAATNDTPQGRAENRRVEFVKI